MRLAVSKKSVKLLFRIALVMAVGIFNGSSVLSQDKAPDGEKEILIAHSANDIVLDSKPVSVKLKNVTTPLRGGFAFQVQNLAPGKRIYLVVKDLYAARSTGDTYNVFLDMPDDVPADRRKDYYAGTITFFDVLNKKSENVALEDERSFSYDVTNLVKRLAAEKKLREKTTVTILAAGSTSADAKSVVGSLHLLEL